MLIHFKLRRSAQRTIFQCNQHKKRPKTEHPQITVKQQTNPKITKNNSANIEITTFAELCLVPLTGLEFYHAVFLILGNAAQTT